MQRFRHENQPTHMHSDNVSTWELRRARWRLGRIVLAAEIKASGSQRRLIVLWMPGGPSQLDTFDLKPGHANGGPFKELTTSVPGMRFSEHLPELGKVAEHLSTHSRHVNERRRSQSRDFLGAYWSTPWCTCSLSCVSRSACERVSAARRQCSGVCQYPSRIRSSIHRHLAPAFWVLRANR